MSNYISDKAKLGKNVVLEKSKEGDKAEITLTVSRNRLYSDEVSNDMMKSFDIALGKVERQLRKHKEKKLRK